MKRLVMVLLLCAGGVQMSAECRDSLLVMFWNVENFFDWTDQGTGESDAEFSSYGGKHWTRVKFYAKCDVIAKAIMWAGDRYGRMPDVIALAEVENRGVLTKLLNYTLLRKYDYSIVHRESVDRRGIDVALLYRRSSMKLLSWSFKTPCLDGVPLPTRDILYSCMQFPDGNNMDFIVNHHPSKYGGVEESAQKRKLVMNYLKSLCDSLVARGGNRIVAMGDFNDTPDAEQFSIIESLLENKGLPLHQNGKGSIRYKGRWELIDFFLTRGVEDSRMEVLEIPFLMTYDRSYPGYKPLRTYSGPRYIGGVSDHCPILLRIF
jgi:endonuclease/exonuclease/phosphatase family metal-dependent hydrolase